MVHSKTHMLEACLGEFFATWLLCYVILRTTLNKKSLTFANENEDARPTGAVLSIGLTVFLAHLLLIPIDGCSINPTRTLGPNLVAYANEYDHNKNAGEHLWVFLIFPELGALFAAAIWKL